MVNETVPGSIVGFSRHSSLPEQLKKLRVKWGWVLVTGIAYMIVGFIAFLMPVGSTYGLTIALGSVLAAGGVLALLHGFHLRGHVGNGWRALQAIIPLVAGIVILRFPEAGMLGISIAMSFYFLMSAFAKGVLALGMRPHKGWGWAFLSATSSFGLGMYVIITFPVSALWLPGFLLGLDLLILGSSLIGFSFNLKNDHQAG